ncbi:Leucine carboxyl methyltransferase 1 [Dinochytrium kinnereticum]|nr:Leucine carboxyl methyltransferase 1 [Dinochytrium kinnereticum]
MGLQPTRYFEIDFPEITSRKAMLMKKNKVMASMLGENKIAAGGCEIHGVEYSLLSGDLRQWESSLVPKLESVGFSKSAPTLYLSECVLVYMEEEFINTILSWCARTTVASFFITYEQIRPDDAFGKTMIENLKVLQTVKSWKFLTTLKLRNISLPGLESCPSLESHVARFEANGWTNEGGSTAVTMSDAYDIYLGPEEKARVAKLEIFDEVEEWRMMGDHYCMSWAWCVPADVSGSQKGDMRKWLEEISLSKR